MTSINITRGRIHIAQQTIQMTARLFRGAQWNVFHSITPLQTQWERIIEASYGWSRSRFCLETVQQVKNISQIYLIETLKVTRWIGNSWPWDWVKVRTHTQLLDDAWTPIIIEIWNGPPYSLLSETVITWFHHHMHINSRLNPNPHSHTISSHTPFMRWLVKYYLSRCFSIFQWITCPLILSAFFQCCVEGTRRDLLNMRAHFESTLSFSINAAIFALWVTGGPCLCLQDQGGPPKKKTMFAMLESMPLGSFQFCAAVPLKDRCRIAAEIFFHVFHWFH